MATTAASRYHGPSLNALSPVSGPRPKAVEAVSTEKPKVEAIRGHYLGRYALRYHVASGGMGAVYLADLRSGKDFRKWVAVKVIHTDVAQSRKFVEMFRREARLAAHVVDPYVCQVFDFGEASGTCYLAMEYLHGQPLSTVAERASRKGGLSPILAARMIADAARGLHALHTVRSDDGSHLAVVHRDVSPQNLFVLYTGVTKILDFGIARPAHQEGEFTRTGEIKGKPAYLAPEQARGEPVTPKVDLWALGVVLWEVTLGRRLFRRNSDAESLSAVLNDPVPLPTQVRPDYPKALESIILRVLNRDPALRHGSALELARELEAFINDSQRGSGTDAVSDYLAAQFETERKEREALLRVQFDSITPPPDDEEEVTEYTGHSRVASGVRPKARTVWPLAAVLGLSSVLAAVGIAYALKSPSTAAAPTALASREVPPMAAPMTARTVGTAAAPEARTAAVPSAAPAVTAPAVHPTAHAAPRAHPVAPPAPVAAAARPAGEAHEGWGHFTLNAPPARVYLGSRELGHTPLYAVSLPAGDHAIRVVPDDGGVPHETQVSVESGATTALRMSW